MAKRGRPKNPHTVSNSERTKKWITDNPVRYYELRKQWRMNNPAKLRASRLRTKQQHNDESQAFATNSGMLWDSSEIQFIRENAHIMTARDIACCISRSYAAVMVRACREKIKLMTYNKIHGRLITGKSSEYPGLCNSYDTSC